MVSTAGPRVAVAPSDLRGWLADAVVAGGGTLVAPQEAEVLVWTATADPDGLRELLDESPGVRWVQLPWAGIEPYVPVLDDRRRWTCGKGVYAAPVAEHVVALALAGMRGLATYASATTWLAPQGTNLLGADVTVVGGGGITEELLRLLQPFGARVTVVRRRPSAMDGAAEVVGTEGLDGALEGRDLVVLALALTPETTGIIDARRLAVMGRRAWLVNVARGAHVVTDDLVDALRRGAIAGAALDVTDPEPLPDGHPLWDLPNCIVTPHVGNTPDMAVPLLSARISENVRRWAAGRPLLGPVDPALGY